MRKKSWAQKQSLAWELFLLENGYNADDARRLGGFFGAQDAFETADGTNRGARELNNFGGMMTKDGYIRYNTPRDYMAAKLSMMQRRFGDALNAQSIDEFAQILGDPARAGRNYLYYVTDEVGYDPHNQAWRDAQTRHMHNYINGMRSKVGMAPLNFAGDNRGRIQIVDDGLQLASPLPQNQAAPIATSLPQNVVQPPRVRTKQVNKILPEIQVYGTNKSLRVPEQRPTHQSLRLTFNDYFNYEMLRQAGMVDDDADFTNMFLSRNLNRPKYGGGKDPEQQLLSGALNNFFYRLLSFVPYTRTITNLGDIYGFSPDTQQSSIEDLTDGSGLVAGVLGTKKHKPVNNGTLARLIADHKNRSLRNSLLPLRAIDIIGDLRTLYKDYKILNDAAKKNKRRV